VGVNIANKLRQTVEDFRFFWKEQVFSVGVSIGLVPFLAPEESSDMLINEADAACYTAKEAGRNRVQVYDAAAAEKMKESQIVNTINDAFENNKMLLFQQRIKSSTNNYALDHYEILIRMRGDNNEVLSPGMFLPAVERYGLAIMLDQWVITTVFKWLANHFSSDEQSPSLAINLSGQSVTDDHFIDFVREQFSLYDIAPEKICFEITETAAMYNLNIAQNFIEELKQQGCQFALDDFGSGHAAYAQLKHLPVDYLKIDGSLVKDILDDPIDFSIVKSVNEVGQVLGMKTIAEFVENDLISQKLSHIGVDFLQGYGIARPAPIDELL